MAALNRAELTALGYVERVPGHWEKVAQESATSSNEESRRRDNAGSTPAVADISWQEMEARCRAVFEKAGCTVYSTSQRRKSKVSAGLPDLVVFGPPGRPFMTFWETKHGKGKLSDGQRKFALHCQRTGTQFQCGGEHVARQWLKHLMETATR